MKATRITDDTTRPDAITLTVGGEQVQAYAGESVATALMAAGFEAMRTDTAGAPRAPYCNMGVCFDCLVVVEGTSVRACMTTVVAGMNIDLT